MDKTTALSLTTKLISHTLQLGFNPTESAQDVDGFFIKNEQVMTNALPLTSTSSLKNLIHLRKLTNVSDKSCIVFLAIGYGKSCVDILELMALPNGDAWLMNKLIEEEEQSFQIRKDNTLAAATFAWERFQATLANALIEFVNRC